MQPLHPDTLGSARPTEGLEATLEAVERHLGALGAALRDRDAAAIELHAAGLHRALAAAIHRFSRASRLADSVPAALRQRLALAGGQVAAQRESLARATAALDRAIDVLMPVPMPVAVYDTAGHGQRPSTSGFVNA